jgi:hypothetical protein
MDRKEKGTNIGINSPREMYRWRVKHKKGWTDERQGLTGGQMNRKRDRQTVGWAGIQIRWTVGVYG